MSHNRKQVRRSFNELPEPGEGEEVALVAEPRGSNQVLVEQADGEQNIVVVPSKFHKVVFLRKGDLVIVKMEPSMRKEQSKVVGTVVTCLHHEQAKHLAAKGLVPPQWRDKYLKPQNSRVTVEDMMPPSDSDEEDAGGGGLNNRRELDSSSE